MADLSYDGSVLAYWVTTLSAPANPTAVQILAGVPLHPQMTPSGLAYGSGNDTIDNSKINSTFTTNAVGRRNFAPQVTIIRDSTDSGGIEAALTFKAVGFLVIRKNKLASVVLAAGDKVDVFPGQIGNAQPNDPAPNTLQTLTYQVTMTGDANLNVTVA